MTGNSDCKSTILYRRRYAVLYSLRKAGYYVHMHAYEYVIGDYRRLIAVLLLEPLSCKAEIYPVPGSPREKLESLIKVLNRVMPGIKVVVHAHTYTM